MKLKLVIVPLALFGLTATLAQGQDTQPNAWPGWHRVADTSPPPSSFQKSLKQPHKINQANKKRYSPDIQRIAKKYRLDPALIHAVISAESGYNPNAVSSKGAIGLMQLMPATARRFGVDPYNPVANITGGARYLRLLLNRFKNISLVLAAYNAGEGAVKRYRNTIPPYPETRRFVVRVIHFYMYYRRQ